MQYLLFYDTTPGKVLEDPANKAAVRTDLGTLFWCTREEEEFDELDDFSAQNTKKRTRTSMSEWVSRPRNPLRCIPLAQLIGVYGGAHSPLARAFSRGRLLDKEKSDRCFSLVAANGVKVHFFAPTLMQKNAWCYGMKMIFQTCGVETCQFVL